MKFSQVISASVALLPAMVSAHGYVESALINNINYTLYNFNTDPYTTPTPERINRKIPGNGPIEDVSLIDIQCNGYTAGGFTTAPAALQAPVDAGSTISLEWTVWPDSHKGPIITYMAKCPDSCTDYSPGTDAVWFKIAEAGKDASGVWATTPLETSPAGLYDVTIPAALAPGNYLVRHEIIALHAAYSYPGAQFYPTCLQVTVSGSGTAQPTDLVAFPGAYTADTPGIVYDIYTNSSSYPIPGPTVWSGASSGAASTSVAAAASSSVAATSVAAVSSSAVATSSAVSSAAAVVTSASSVSSVATTLATSGSSSSTAPTTLVTLVSQTSTSSSAVATATDAGDDTCEA